MRNRMGGLSYHLLVQIQYKSLYGRLIAPPNRFATWITILCPQFGKTLNCQSTIHFRELMCGDTNIFTKISNDMDGNYVYIGWDGSKSNILVCKPYIGNQWSGTTNGKSAVCKTVARAL